MYSTAGVRETLTWLECFFYQLRRPNTVALVKLSSDGINGGITSAFAAVPKLSSKCNTPLPAISLKTKTLPEALLLEHWARYPEVAVRFSFESIVFGACITRAWAQVPIMTGDSHWPLSWGKFSVKSAICHIFARISQDPTPVAQLVEHWTRYPAVARSIDCL